MAHSVDRDQTAPKGAVCSGSTLFASLLNSSVMLGSYLQQTTSTDDIFRCIFMPPKELWEAYSNRTVRPSVRPSVPLRVQCTSSIFFEVGIPNLVCGCILGWRIVAYYFWVTVTLTSD